MNTTRTFIASQWDYLDTDGELLGQVNRFPTGEWYALSGDTEIGWYPTLDAAIQALTDFVTVEHDWAQVETAHDWDRHCEQAVANVTDPVEDEYQPRLNIIQVLVVCVLLTCIVVGLPIFLAVF